MTGYQTTKYFWVGPFEEGFATKDAGCFRTRVTFLVTVKTQLRTGGYSACT
jgi:hypothetical protein